MNVKTWSVTNAGAYFRTAFMEKPHSMRKIGAGRLRSRIPPAFLAERCQPLDRYLQMNQLISASLGFDLT